MSRRYDPDYSSSDDSDSPPRHVAANYETYNNLYEIEEEGEHVVSMERGEPYPGEERILSRQPLPEELVSVDLLSETKVSEQEVSRTMVAKQRLILNRIQEIIEVPVETVVETLSVHSAPNVLEFEVPYHQIIDVEKVIDYPVRVPYPNEIRRPKCIEVDVPFVENYVDRPKIVPVERIITKIIPKYVERIIEVPVERIVIQEEQVFVEKIREKIIEVPVEKLIEKVVRVPVERLVQKVVEVPVEYICETVIEVPTERVVERVVHVPVEGRVIENVVEVEVPGRSLRTIAAPVVQDVCSPMPSYGCAPACQPCQPSSYLR